MILHMFAINSDSSLKLAFLFWIICPYLVKLNLGELYEMKVQAGDNVCVSVCVCVCVEVDAYDAPCKYLADITCVCVCFLVSFEGYLHKYLH